jgi:hypothetical protein
LGDHVGCFESQVVGIGPQIGHIFPIRKDLQGYLNLKAYGEFARLEHLAHLRDLAGRSNSTPLSMRMVTK